MSKLARARLKEPNCLPPWLDCCAEVLEKFAKLKRRELIVDLDTLRARDSRCPCCSNIFPQSIAGSHVYEHNSEWHCPLSLLEIDEGPLESA